MNATEFKLTPGDWLNYSLGAYTVAAMHTEPHERFGGWRKYYSRIKGKFPSFTFLKKGESN